MKKTVYTSNPKTNFFKELGDIISDIRSSQFLAWQVTKRDITAQYRQSFLGFFWAIAPVLSTAIVWIFLNSSGAVSFGDTNIPYPLFVIIGISLWTLFIDSINSPITSLNTSKGILSKINFPKEALLIAGIYKLLFNNFIKLLFVGIFLIYYGIFPNISAIVVFPICILTIILLGSAIGLIIAPIGLLYSDVQRMLGMAFSFIMYITPVVYPEPKINALSKIFEYNPMTSIIVSSRNVLTGHDLYHPEIIYATIPISLVILSIGLVLFRNSMNILIEKIS